MGFSVSGPVRGSWRPGMRLPHPQHAERRSTKFNAHFDNDRNREGLHSARTAEASSATNQNVIA